MKIFALLSIDNNYDQPENNLVAWWPTKPSLIELAKALDCSFPGKSDEETLFVVNVWSGKTDSVQVFNGTQFRLEVLTEGKVPYRKGK